MPKLNKDNIGRSIKYGMSRKDIAKKYKFRTVSDFEEQLKKEFPENWEEILKKIDAGTDKRKSAKKQRMEARYKNLDEEYQDYEEEVNEMEKTLLTPISSQTNEPQTLKKEIERLKRELTKEQEGNENRTKKIEAEKQLQKELGEKINTLRYQLEETCKKYIESHEMTESLKTSSEEKEQIIIKLKKELEDKEAELDKLTKKFVKITASNKIEAEDLELDFNGYKEVFLKLIQREDLAGHSVNEITTISKVVAAAKNSKTIELKFEAIKLQELYELVK